MQHASVVESKGQLQEMGKRKDATSWAGKQERWLNADVSIKPCSGLHKASRTSEAGLARGGRNSNRFRKVAESRPRPGDRAAFCPIQAFLFIGIP